VCPGGQLELMCTTSTAGMFLQWSFDLIRGRETTPTHFTRTVTPSSSTMSYLIVNSVLFNFSRISAQASLPLMSQLLIGPLIEGLNGIEVNCEDINSSERATTVITVVECQCPGKYYVCACMHYCYHILVTKTNEISNICH
jgi:hypothetical protein